MEGEGDTSLPAAKSFKLKKDLTAYIRAALAELGPTLDLERADPRLYAFFIDLFRSHPRADTKLHGLVRVEVVRSGLVGKTSDRGSAFGFMLSYENKPADDISWAKCVSNTNCGSSPKKERPAASRTKARFGEAMRQAVQPQVDNARAAQGEGWVCQRCGENGRGTRFHMDHYGKTFAELVSSFVGDRSDVPDGDTGVDDAPLCLHKHEFGPQHQEFVKDWQEYHLKNATLQLVCIQCNLVELKKDRQT